MTIFELGALGEFIASIAVIVTLTFLVVELRRNTSATRRANIRQSTDGNSRALNALLDEGVAEIFIRGLKSLDDLSEVERYRFDNSLFVQIAVGASIILAIIFYLLNETVKSRRARKRA